MSLKHGILGLLAYKPMAGYDLMKTFDKSLAFFWNAQTSQIYRDLDGLTASGWAELHEELQQGKRVKSVYSITEAGRAELLRWLGEDGTDKGGFKSVFLLRLFFQGQAGLEPLRKLVEAKRALAEENAARLRAVLGALDGGHNPKDELTGLCWSMTAEYGLRQFETEARWAEDFLARLDAFERKEA